MYHEITTDGITVWINGEGALLGRFGVMGVDIHTQDMGECLQCTHARTTPEDWEDFKTGMLTHYGVVIADKYKPVRFRPDGDTKIAGRTRSAPPKRLKKVV